MLSRIAESLYWIGRYVERAEDTSRILDVHLTLLLDDPWAPEDVVCASLAIGDGRRVARPVTIRPTVLDLSGVGHGRPGRRSWASIAVARENARRSREVISTDCGRASTSPGMTPAAPSRRARPHAFFTWVRERAAAFNGVADATLSRDEACTSSTLGRSIERADMTARLVGVPGVGGRTRAVLGHPAASCGAYQAFLRSSRGAVDDRRAAEFLLLDPLFPRSMMQALVAAEVAWTSCGAQGDRSVPHRARRNGCSA